MPNLGKEHWSYSLTLSKAHSRSSPLSHHNFSADKRTGLRICLRAGKTPAFWLHARNVSPPECDKKTQARFPLSAVGGGSPAAAKCFQTGQCSLASQVALEQRSCYYILPQLVKVVSKLSVLPGPAVVTVTELIHWISFASIVGTVISRAALWCFSL